MSREIVIRYAGNPEGDLFALPSRFNGDFSHTWQELGIGTDHVRGSWSHAFTVSQADFPTLLERNAFLREQLRIYGDDRGKKVLRMAGENYVIDQLFVIFSEHEPLTEVRVSCDL